MPAIHPASKTTQLYNSPAQESSKVTCVAEAGVEGSFRLTCPAFAGAAQADYFTFGLPDGSVVAVWLDKDAAGTAPTGAAYVAADVQVEADIVTGDSATVVAGAVATALGAVDIDITDNADGTLDLLQQTMGAHAAPARHNANDSGNGSFVLSLQVAGVDSNYLNSYFTIDASDGTDYYVWFNSNSEGVDPAVAGKTGLEIAVAIGDSANTIGAAIETALDATAKFSSTNSSGVVTIVDVAAGDAVDISNAGSSPATISSLVEGFDGQITAATAVSSLTNNPSPLSD